MHAIPSRLATGLQKTVSLSAKREHGYIPHAVVESYASKRDKYGGKLRDGTKFTSLVTQGGGRFHNRHPAKAKIAHPIMKLSPPNGANIATAFGAPKAKA